MPEARDSIEEPVGRPIPRAKPIVMTFYDTLWTYPYTATFHVREDTPDEDCNQLVRAASALSECVLGKYRIGYQEFVVPNYREQLQAMRPGVMGTHRWRVKYYDAANYRARTCTIPGANIVEYGIDKRTPKLKHPAWKEFLDIFAKVAVTKEGNPISPHADVSASMSNWPPKGAKKLRR